MQRLIYTFFILLIWSRPAIAQDNLLKEYAPVAPNAASLGKYADVPVSYHTGLPDVSVPVFTLAEGAISAPISLSYHASGIKVQETASWALNAGGMITRTVQGAPDERGSSGNFGQTSGWYADKATGRTAYNGCTTPSDIASGQYDTEPDIFTFNFGGYSGKFFYDKDSVPTLVTQQDLKIFTINLGSQLFSGWIIVDPEGNRYHFGATSSAMQQSDFVEQNIYTYDPFVVPKNSSWYLSKIESADRKDLITFCNYPAAFGGGIISSVISITALIA